MVVKHFYKGKVYEIEAPAGSRVHRSSLGGSVLYTPNPEGGEHFIPDWPGCLMPQIAEKGEQGLRLISGCKTRFVILGVYATFLDSLVL